MKVNYIPEFLLRNFSDDGETICAVSKEVGLARPLLLFSVTCEYETKDKDIKRIEKVFPSVEEKACAIINEKVRYSEDLSGEERTVLTAFVVLMTLRMPWSMDKVKEFSENFVLKGSPCTERLAKMFPLFQRDIFKCAMELFTNEGDLVVWESKEPFVLSDIPVGFVPLIPNVGLYGDQIYLPVTPYRCLTFLRHSKLPYKRTPSKYVNLLNQESLNRSMKGVYAI